MLLGITCLSRSWTTVSSDCSVTLEQISLTIIYSGQVNVWNIWILLLISLWFSYRVVPLYPRVIRSKTYRGHVTPRIIPNAVHNVTFV
jgi:hypothetical protein